MADTTTYTTTVGEQRVELELDQRFMVPNRARLVVGGETVDSMQVVSAART